VGRIRTYYTGRVRRGPGDWTDFDIREFKDDQHLSILVIEESC